MRSTAVVEHFLDGEQFFAHHLAHFLRGTKQGFQLLDPGENLPVFLFNLLAFQGCQPPELQVQDCLGLQLGELEALHQPGSGLVCIRSLADQINHFIQVLQGYAVPFQDMEALASLFQIKLAAAPDNLQPVLQEHPHALFQAQHPGFPVDQGQHNDAESALHGSMTVQVVQDLVRIGCFGELYYDPHALPV